MSIRNYLSESTFSAAYWITPQGKILDCGARKHIDFVCADPKKFGITEKEVASMYAKYNEPVGFEGRAREDIILAVVRKGFIRIRKYRDRWSINVADYNRRAAKILSNWAYDIIQNPQESKYTPVNIACDTGNPPKNIDMEGLSNLLESHEPLVVIRIDEMSDYNTKSNIRQYFDKENWYWEAWDKEQNISIEESSLARIWKKVEDEDKSFGIISAFTSPKSNSDEDIAVMKKENITKHEDLKQKVKKWGYIELRGGFKYKDDEDYTLEKSLLVPNIPKDEILKLGKEYGQYSVIYKDSKEFSELKTDGSLERSFAKAGGAKDGKSPNFSQAKEAVRYFYSSLFKGAHAGRKFAFTEFKLLESRGIQNHIHAMGLSYDNPVLWYNILEN